MQQGSVIREHRKLGPDVWCFRWWEAGPNGNRVHRRIVLGTAEQMRRAHRKFSFAQTAVATVIVMLVPRSTSGRLVALHRFFEVSIGIAVGLGFFALWSRIGQGFSSKASQASSAQ